MNYIENMKTKTKIDLDKNKVYVDISGTATLLEVNCKLDLENPQTIKNIEEDIKNELNKIIDDTKKLVQKEYNTDVLGYGKIIHKKYPKKWKSIKNNWDEIFKNLNIETNINIKIEDQGTLIQTIKEAQ